VFSKRTNYAFAKNALTEALDERRAKGSPILDLTESNPTRAGFVYPADTILKALSSPDSLTYQPEPLGLLKTREAIAAYYAERGRSVEPGHILVTASTSEAYSYLFKLVADPDDQILIPRPSYPLFDYLARLNCTETADYPLVYDGSWRVDLDRLAHVITERTRALVVVNPNNPTGSTLAREEWSAVVEICSRLQLPVICDEVFYDYFHQAPSFDPLRGADIPLFVLNGLSKTVALPQLKLAWMVVSGPQDFRHRALARLEIIADTFLSVSSQVQHATPSLLAARTTIQEQIRGRLLANVSRLHEILDGSPARALHVEAGWYAVVRLPAIFTEDEWVLQLLERNGTLVHPGYFYDFEDGPFVVVSLLTPPEEFTTGIRALVALF
jgi:alanine-synthesizing transaminase